MTDYTNLPQANTLKAELDSVTSAIEMLQTGGTITSITISPAPSGSVGMMKMPASISTNPGSAGATPISEQAIGDLIAWLYERQNDLNKQLSALAVTNIPPSVTSSVTSGGTTSATSGGTTTSGTTTS